MLFRWVVSPRCPLWRMVSYVGEQHGRREWRLCYRRRRKASSWMLEEGKQNIKELSTLLEETATPVYVDR